MRRCLGTPSAIGGVSSSRRLSKAGYCSWSSAGFHVFQLGSRWFIVFCHDIHHAYRVYLLEVGHFHPLVHSDHFISGDEEAYQDYLVSGAHDCSYCNSCTVLDLCSFKKPIFSIHLMRGPCEDSDFTVCRNL